MIRVISGGPGQSTLLLPEVTDGNVPGNLHRMEDRTDSQSDCNSFCLVRPRVSFVLNWGFKSYVHIMRLMYEFNCKMKDQV